MARDRNPGAKREARRALREYRQCHYGHLNRWVYGALADSNPQLPFSFSPEHSLQ